MCRDDPSAEGAGISDVIRTGPQWTLPRWLPALIVIVACAGLVAWLVVISERPHHLLTAAPSPTAASQFFPELISFPSASIGFVLGQDCPGPAPVGPGGCTEQVLRTADGGRNWRAGSPLPRTVTPGGASAVGLVFAGRRDGYAWGYQDGVAVSGDGGRRWAVALAGRAVTALAASPASHTVWVLAERADCPAAAGCSSGGQQLLTAPLGSTRFVPLPHQPPDVSRGQELLRPTGGSGYLIAGQSRAGQRLSLDVTHDGGRGWVRLPLPCPLGSAPGASIVDAVAVLRSRRLLLDCEFVPSGAGRPTQWLSTDGGVQWRVWGAPVSAVTELLPAGHLIWAVRATGLAKSTDLGLRWQDALPAGFDTGNGISVAANPAGVVWALPASSGSVEALAVSRGGASHTIIWRSADGGRDWQKVPLL